MGKNTLTSAAVFMICLIVMFPVYSSAAMADSGISLIRTYDEHNVEGFMRTGGEFTVEANVLVEGDVDINTSQVKIGVTDFEECGNPDPNNMFTCLYSFSTLGVGMNKPSQSYAITLYDDLDAVVDTKNAVITFDDEMPVVESFDVPSIVGRGTFAVDYEVRDPTTSQSGCSGIGGINIYLNDADEPFMTEIINTSLCGYSGVIEMQGSSLNDGMNLIKIDVFDRLVQESFLVSRSVDAELSEIVVVSAEFLDDSSDTIIWFVTRPIEALLVVNFSGPAIKENTVKADLSAVNPVLQSVFADRCSESDGITSCEWDSVEIDISSAKTAALTFEMEDYAGNQVVKTTNLPMPVDTQGPRVTSLRSVFAGTMNYMHVENNKFVAGITENAALDPLKINLYIGDVSRGDASYYVKAESCELVGASQWECNFTGIDLPAFVEGSSNIYILTDSKDKYGNNFTNTHSIDIIMDNTPPELLNRTQKIISAEEDMAERDYVQVGDSLEVTVRLKEENELGDIYADFSSIISDANHSVPSCVKEGEGWVCVWQPAPIDKGYTDSHYSLHIEDMAGNAIPQDIVVPIEVLGVEEAETIEWSADVKFSSPQAIDRQIVTLYEPFMWVALELLSEDSAVIPTDISITDCFNTPVENGDKETEDDEDALDAAAFLLDVPEVYNYNTIDSSPDSPYKVYVKFNFRRMAPAEGDSLGITCTFNIKGIKDGRIVVYAQPVNASFNINYFNNNIGEVQENVNEEIENVRGSWLVQAEILDDLEKILNYAQMVCSLMNTWAEIWNIIGIISDWSGSTCAGSAGMLSGTCTMSQFTGKAAETGKNAHSKFYRDYNNYCKMLNCQYARDDKYNKKDGLHAVINAMLGNAEYTEGLRQTGRDAGFFFDRDTDVKSSIIFSLVYSCLPGVIYNLQKARVLDCIYINCLKQVKDGMPLTTCTSQRGYGYCKFVFGQIFHFLPLGAVSEMVQKIAKALSHPLEMLNFAMSIYCKGICESPVGVYCSACSYAEFSNLILDVLCDLSIVGDEEKCSPIWESFAEVDENECTLALAEDEEGDEVEE